MAGFFTSSLSSDWQARLSKITIFNDYAKDHQVKLADVEIKDYDLTGMVMPKGNFNNTHWQNVKARNSHWGKVTIKGGQFEKVDFTGSQFDQVVFEDVTFVNVQFDESQLKNVKFINADMKQTDFWSVKEGNIDFIKSKISKTNASKIKATIKLINSEITGGRFTGSLYPSSFIATESIIEDTDFSDSQYNEFMVSDSKVHETALTKGKIEKMELINSGLHFGLTASTIKKLLIAGSEMTLLAFDSAKLSEVNIQRCKKNMKLNFYQAEISNMSFDQCPLSDTHLVETNIETLVISNSSLEDSKFMDMKANNVTFRKVELKGTLNFTGATIKNLKTEGLIKAPGLKLITEGSNVKF